MMNTPQELGRTAHPHQHDTSDAFCLECITRDLLRDDMRHDIALLAAIELKHLAGVRASLEGLSWRDEWIDVLDVAALQADLRSENAVRRVAAHRAKEAVTNFLIYRMATASADAIRLRLAPQLREIERRTLTRLDAVERFGHEPTPLAQLVQ